MLALSVEESPHSCMTNTPVMTFMATGMAVLVGPPLCSSLKYLHNPLMDCHGILLTQPWSPEDGPWWIPWIPDEVKYLNSCWMDCHEIYTRCSRSRGATFLRLSRSSDFSSNTAGTSIFNQSCQISQRPYMDWHKSGFCVLRFTCSTLTLTLHLCNSVRRRRWHNVVWMLFPPFC